jgi:hypothetical protein
MVVPVGLEGKMAALLWACSLVAMGLVLVALREARDPAPDRWWSYPVQPALAELPLASWADPGPLTRPSPRPALQTGVTILAIALAIDVSAAPLAQLAPIEPAAAAAGLHDFTTGQDAFAAYAPASWTLASSSASDGWFV